MCSYELRFLLRYIDHCCVQDSITITVGDQKRLKLGEWLNDNLIDLRIKLLVFHVDIKKYASFYCAIDSDSPAPLNHPELSGEG